MTIQTVASVAGGLQLDDSVRTQFIADYEASLYYDRVYDQLAAPIGKPMEELQKGSSVQVNFLSKMDIPTTAISEVADLVPQALRDSTASVTPTSRAGAVQVSENIWIKAYTNYHEEVARTVAENANETIDGLARDAATQGSLVIRSAARASLDAGTTSHRGRENEFISAGSRLYALKAPMFISADGATKVWAAITTPDVFHDVRRDGNLQAVGQYQKAGIHLNWELAQIGPFRVVVHPWAKVFGAAGDDAGSTVSVATTLNSAAQKLATTIAVAAGTNMALASAGRWLTIGTEETANTHYPDNEMVWLTGFTGSTATIVGQGPNGGLRFDHASGAGVRSADNVHTIVFGGPMSLAKVYATSVGEYGQLVGPKRDGLVDQFLSLGWKWYGAYGRIGENRLIRAEVSVSSDA